MRRWLLSCALVLALRLYLFSAEGALPCAENRQEISPELQRAASIYDAGWGGSDQALLEAMEQLEDLLRSEQRSPLVRAYYGSSCIARARMVPDRQKPTWLRRGAAELDAAVKAAPEDVQVRLLRAKTFAVLPRMVGRIETAQEDFDWLVAQAERRKKERPEVRRQGAEDRRQGTGGTSFLSPDCRQVIFYHAGAFALRNRQAEAVAFLEKAAAIESGMIGQERIARMLRLAREQFRHDDPIRP